MYNPNDFELETTERKQIEEGEYFFKVTEISKETWPTGTQGFRVVMDINIDANTTVKGFENIFLSPRAGWKLKAFMESLGQDFMQPPVTEQALVGAYGRARFIKNDKGYLAVDQYLDRAEYDMAMQRGQRAAARPPRPTGPVAPPNASPDDDYIPF